MDTAVFISKITLIIIGTISITHLYHISRISFNITRYKDEHSNNYTSSIFEKVFYMFIISNNYYNELFIFYIFIQKNMNVF